ncbi:NADH-ubiquinone oxidoreductase chain J [hydrothermal vent metagenome]|uniref:NADH-ubiquinone oxidoreductase chain J n=1 Tax=hydrothermal vent metagenome TaxID=652676 RepID=A0A3B0YIA7_9ZZZZ
MEFERIVFYVFATILVFAATRVITVRNPVHAALHLVLAFFTCAGLWLLLEAEFLAITLVLVYVGAVMVLFLFVVMMLDINVAEVKEGFARNLPVGLTVAVLMILELWLVMKSKAFNAEQMPMPPPHPEGYSNTREIGSVLYTDYVYPFELASVILVVAIIAAITLTLSKRKVAKTQNPSEQVKVRREDRVRIIKMEAENRD